MKVDLVALARRLPDAPRREGPVVLPAITPTLALQGELAGIYIRVVAEWQRLVREVIVPVYGAARAELLPAGMADAMRFSDDLAEVRNASEGAGEAAGRILVTLAPFLRQWALRLERWHRMRWIANIKARSGVDLAPLIGPEDVSEAIEAAVAQNVALIRSVSDQARANVAGIVLRGFQKRTPTRVLAREISESLRISRRRALFIASDQTTKLSASLDIERMKQVGIGDFRWQHSGKLHYRPEHKRRNGKIYSLAKPPPTMPGQEIHCGCKARAVLRLESGRWS